MRFHILIAALALAAPAAAQPVMCKVDTETKIGCDTSVVNKSCSATTTDTCQNQPHGGVIECGCMPVRPPATPQRQGGEPEAIAAFAGMAAAAWWARRRRR